MRELSAGLFDHINLQFDMISALEVNALEFQEFLKVDILQFITSLMKILFHLSSLPRSNFSVLPHQDLVS